MWYHISNPNANRYNKIYKQYTCSITSLFLVFHETRYNQHIFSCMTDLPFYRPMLHTKLPRSMLQGFCQEDF